MAAFLDRFDSSRDGLWVAVAEDRVVGVVAVCGREAETLAGHVDLGAAFAPDLRIVR